MKVMLDNEECWVLKGGFSRSGWFWRAKYDRYTVGQPATVAFDHRYVYHLEDENVPWLGWLHTHPHWTANPSGTDHATMTAWAGCLGRPLLCCILGTDRLRAWWYVDDESPPVEGAVRRSGTRLSGVVPEAVHQAFNKAEEVTCGA